MLAQNRAISRIISAPKKRRNSRSPVAWKYCQTLYAMAALTWRCRCEASGSQRPDTGLRCMVWVSSRPLLALCHGNIAPA